MVKASQDRNRDRIKSAVGAALFHALLGYGLIAGLGVDIAADESDVLKLFDVPEPAPPPPVEEPAQAPATTEREERAAAPPNLEARPAPVVAPPPEVRLEVPPPVVAAPVAGPDSDPSAGAAPIAGPGTGSGGVGDGTGGGGGGVAVKSHFVSGSLGGLDNSRTSRDARGEGSISMRFAVETDGRVSGCRVTRSSGDPAFDSDACRLAEARFRYEPARDAGGRLVRDEVNATYGWWVERRRRSRAGFRY